MRASVLVVFPGLVVVAAGQTTGPLKSIFGNPLASTLAAADTVPVSYYFPHLAMGGGWQTTLTYVNYSPQVVTCNTSFMGDDGTPVQPPFTTPIPTQLGPGASFHIETQATGGVTGAWAKAGCSGPIKASLLFRFYFGATPVTEAGVNATTTGATEFVSYAESNTGIALANPSTAPANITVKALDSTGAVVFTSTLILNPNGHMAANLNGLTGAPPGLNFTGSIQITSDVPVLALSLNAEKFLTLPNGAPFPVVSSLPPGDLPDGTPLATGH